MIRAGLAAVALAVAASGPAAASGGGIPTIGPAHSVLRTLDDRPGTGAPVVIAVLEFGANNTSANDATVVTGFVRSALVRTLAFKVVDRADMRKILDEQAFQQTGCVSDECAVRLGKLLNVQRVVTGTYAVFEGVRVVSAQIVDVETGRILASESERFQALTNVDRAVDELVDRLLADERRVLLRSGDESEPAAPAVRADPSKQGSFWGWLLSAVLLAGALGGIVAATAH